jgi:hypothetical protein
VSTTFRVAIISSSSGQIGSDRATPEVAEAKAERLKEKIETLKKQM